MAFKRLLRKVVANHFVAVAMSSPYILLNATIQIILDVGFHWTGFMSIFAWMIGGGSSISLGVFIAMLTKSNFRIGAWKWNYAEEQN